MRRPHPMVLPMGYFLVQIVSAALAGRSVGIRSAWRSRMRMKSLCLDFSPHGQTNPSRSGKGLPGDVNLETRVALGTGPSQVVTAGKVCGRRAVDLDLPACGRPVRLQLLSHMDTLSWIGGISPVTGAL